MSGSNSGSVGSEFENLMLDTLRDILQEMKLINDQLKFITEEEEDGSTT